MAEATWPDAMNQTAADTQAALAEASGYTVAYQNAAAEFLLGPGEDAAVDADDVPPSDQQPFRQ